MFAKIAALIVAIGIVACSLLAIRQSRILAAAETAQVQRRVAEHDRTLWHLRLEIASRVLPGAVEPRIGEQASLKPISPERLTELARAEQAAARNAVTTNTNSDSPNVR